MSPGATTESGAHSPISVTSLHRVFDAGDNLNDATAFNTRLDIDTEDALEASPQGAYFWCAHVIEARLFGNESYNVSSRFIHEIPDELIETLRPCVQVSRPYGMASAASTMREDAPDGLELGQRVLHAKFGDGVVLNYEGQGAQARVQVNFERAGSKWLVVAYANLQTMSLGRCPVDKFDSPPRNSITGFVF